MITSNKVIPYGRHEIKQEDIDAVVETLKSDFLTQGPKIKEFEDKFADYIGSKYAVAVSNGTAALHLSALALGVKKGTNVITSPLTFVASSNAILHSGGRIDFCDIDPETLLIDFKELRNKLAKSRKGSYSGIIAVDFAGLAIQMDELKKIADDFGLWILEDACHAPGGFYIDSNGEKQNCGNCKNSDLAIFSFHPVKHISCGEGGMITTNNLNHYKLLLKLRSHGITKSKNELTENHGGWYYEMNDLGYNYRLTDISAAMGISQLNRAKGGVQKRADIAKIYFSELEHINGIKFYNKIHTGHAYHLLVIRAENRDKLYN